jgi:transketolase
MMNNVDLAAKAYELRIGVLNTIWESDTHNGHLGGSLSMCEIMAVLYWEVLNIDPQNPSWKDRDRMILSKAHSVPGTYAALALRGYFDPKLLGTYRKQGSFLQGHADCRKTPGLDNSGGSLGQGLSVALGVALGARHSEKAFNVYVVTSDGELNEGMSWEAIMAAAHMKVDNLYALVDNNGLQSSGPTREVMNLEPLESKWRCFGWDVTTVDGHDAHAILAAIRQAQKIKNQPKAIICRTVKGKGVSFMENNPAWHCNTLTKELYDQAIKELKGAYEAVCQH